MINSVKWCDPQVYGIDWDATDEDPKASKPSGPIIRAKPICEYDGCELAVSTEFNRPKPYCRDHVFENPYVQDVLRRYQELDEREDRKLTAERWELMKKEYSEGNDELKVEP